MLVLVIGVFAGCSSESESNNSPSLDVDDEDEPEMGTSATELVVRFDDNGAHFVMHLYDNDTARAIARHVGTADWRLPIYNYEGYENWEVMQYYDIPSRYEIPSNPETVTEITLFWRAGAIKLFRLATASNPAQKRGKQ